jgi:hypothetical protein
MYSTLAIFSMPKSGTPDFGVKPGNDGGNRGTSVLHPFDRDLLFSFQASPCSVGIGLRAAQSARMSACR